MCEVPICIDLTWEPKLEPSDLKEALRLAVRRIYMMMTMMKNECSITVYRLYKKYVSDLFW